MASNLFFHWWAWLPRVTNKTLCKSIAKVYNENVEEHLANSKKRKDCEYATTLFKHIPNSSNAYARAEKLSYVRKDREIMAQYQEPLSYKTLKKFVLFIKQLLDPFIIIFAITQQVHPHSSELGNWTPQWKACRWRAFLFCNRTKD